MLPAIVVVWSAIGATAPSAARNTEIRRLIADLRKGPQGARNRAAQRLYHLQDAEGNAAVERLAEHGDPELRAIGTWALSIVKPGGAEALVRRRLEDRSAIVRRAAVLAASSLQSAATASKLVRLLHDEDRFVRRASVRALGQLGNVGLPGLRQALRRGTPEQRLLAIRALGVVHTKRARMLLRWVGSQGTPLMRLMSARELVQQTDRSGYRVLRALLASRAPKGIRLQAIRALAADRRGRSRRALQRALKNRDADIRRAAADALAGG